MAIEVNGALVGSSGVTFAGPRLGPEIGYWQKDPRAPRPSHARAGTLHGGQWALGLGAPRVHLWVDVENTPSQAVARRAGFVQEGVVPAALDRRDGSRADAVLFGRVP